MLLHTGLGLLVGFAGEGGGDGLRDLGITITGRADRSPDEDQEHKWLKAAASTVIKICTQSENSGTLHGFCSGHDLQAAPLMRGFPLL